MLLNVHDTTDFNTICDSLYRHLSGEMKFEGSALESEFNSIMESNYALYHSSCRNKSIFANVPEMTMDMVRNVFNKYFDTDAKLIARYGEDQFHSMRNRGLI